MNNKYEITEETHPRHPQLRRIKALRDIPMHGVKAGDLGGWIESEYNLTHAGDAWIAGEAQVYDEALVSGNAYVCSRAQVYGMASVKGNVDVSGKAQVYGEAMLYGNARVSGEAHVFERALVSHEAYVHGDARVYGEACVLENARVYWNARVYDNARVGGKARISGNADVSKVSHTLQAQVMASGRFDATLHRNTDGHMLHVGCWHGTVPEFRTMIESDQWVEATPKEIKLRRPEMLAFTAMCEARIAAWGPRAQVEGPA